MKICRVVGTVTPAQSVDRIKSPTYLLVEPSSTSGKVSGGPFVAVDSVQAGTGDLVLVAQGSSCRQIAAPDMPETADTALDALIIGVIDLIDEGGELVYRAAAP